MTPVGLLTGSKPFAGLPDNPAEDLLAEFDGRMVQGIAVRAIATPVSLARLPSLVPELIRQHRPVFVVSLGLALGAPVLSVETSAINRVDFGIADNDGARPTDGAPIQPGGPAARFATWDAGAVVNALLARDLPASISHHAGTHLCNAMLYLMTGAMSDAGLVGPVGFFHLPYTTAQVARLLRESPAQGASAPDAPRALANMSLDDQRRAVEIVLDTVARGAAQR